MKRYHVLDGMRGIAALCVMLMHASTDSEHPLLLNAGIAVDFFFILSGFVIAHSYGARIDMSLREFMSRRIIRLYPLFFLGLAIGAPIFFLCSRYGFTDYGNGAIIASLAYNIVYLPYLNGNNIFHKIGVPTQGAIFPVNGPSWSLFFEIVANLFFFLMYRSGLRTMRVVVASSFVAMIATGILTALARGKIGCDLGGGWGTLNFASGIPRVFYGFGIGIVIHMVVKNPSSVRLRRALAKHDFVMYGLFAVLVLMFMLPFNGLLYLLEIALAAPFLVFIGAATPCNSTLCLPVARFLGGLSYPVYCLHYPIMQGIEALGRKGYAFGTPSYVMTALLSILAVIVITKTYDEPVRAWLTKVLAGRTQHQKRLGGAVARPGTA